MSYGVISSQQGVNLQATLATSSANGVTHSPHHPISCISKLNLYEDGTLECEHTRVKDDARTQTCLDHSIAILLFEEAYKRFG